MRPLDLPLLADENIHPDVVGALAGQGKDVRTVASEGLGAHADVEILRHAHAAGRVVLTHDADFGMLAIRAREPLVGVVYLRPGHFRATYTLETIAAIERAAIVVTPPFLLVAERRGEAVSIRARMIEAATE